MVSPTPVLMDCDPGHDDAVALLLAAGRPDVIDLRAVTTVGGNAELEKVTLNARRVLTLAGVDSVPVAAGARRPRAGALMTALDVHGQSGLDGATLPEARAPLDPRSAVELMAACGPATVIATGPLTNVATLVEQAPGAIDEIVWMGGSTGRGNTRPYAEFNALVDPEAAAVVFESGIPLTMVGLNLTHQAQATDDVLARLRDLGTPVGAAAVGWLSFYADAYRDVFGLAGPPVHDACAVALVVDPSLMHCEDHYVAIETDGRYTRGATVVDLHGRFGRPPNARVAMELDVPRFWDVVTAALAAL